MPSKETKFNSSENGLFIIENKFPNLLFIRENMIDSKTKSPQKLSKFNSKKLSRSISTRFNKQEKIIIHPWLKKVKEKFFTVQKEKVKYIGYQFFEKMELNDCLHMAESFACNIPHYQAKKSIFREKMTNLKFGYSTKQNLKIIHEKKAVLNDKANPNIGEAYAIVEKNLKEDSVPYHIAFVLYKDGNTNITIEADAGDLSLIFPVFDMYSIEKSKKNSKQAKDSQLFQSRSDRIIHINGLMETFHSKYKNNFTQPVTIVLVSS